MGRPGDFSKAPDFGYCASQNTYYFGYKLHAVCGLSGVIHSYDLSKASVHDLNYMKGVKLEYHDCSIYGDKGYIGADVQLDLFETAHIRFMETKAISGLTYSLTSLKLHISGWNVPTG